MNSSGYLHSSKVLQQLFVSSGPKGAKQQQKKAVWWVKGDLLHLTFGFFFCNCTEIKAGMVKFHSNS